MQSQWYLTRLLGILQDNLMELEKERTDLSGNARCFYNSKNEQNIFFNSLSLAERGFNCVTKTLKSRSGQCGICDPKPKQRVSSREHVEK